MNPPRRTSAELNVPSDPPSPRPDPVVVASCNSVVPEETRNGMILLSVVDDEDPAIDVTPYLRKSQDFHTLTGHLKTLQKQYPEKEGVPLGRRVKAGSRISYVKESIATYEKDVRRLILLKEKISYDSPLLQEVKRHIEDAAFFKANVLLDTQELIAEQTSLLAAKKDNSIEPGEPDSRLRINATCFFLKALLVSLDKTNRRQPTPYQCLKWSARSYAYPDNPVEYFFQYQKTCSGQELEPLYQQIFETDTPESGTYAALALHNIAVMYKESRKPITAEEKFREVLALYRNAEKKNPGSFTPHIAATLANFAALYSERILPPESEAFETMKSLYQESVDLFRICARADLRKFAPILAKTLKKLAKVYLNENNTGAAAGCYSEAVALYTMLQQIDRERYQPLLFEALFASVELSVSTGTEADAHEDCSEALAICRELARNDPGKYLPRLGEILRLQAVIHMDTDRPDLAETELLEAISIFRQFRKLPYRKHPTTNALAIALNEIGVLYLRSHNPERAKREFHRSLALYRSIRFDPLAPFGKCLVLINLSTYYREIAPDQDKSVELASEAIATVRPFRHRAEMFAAMYRNAEDILYYWKVPEDEYDGFF